jgi:hypothetical protein
LRASQLRFRVGDGRRSVAGGAASRVLLLQQLITHGYCFSSKNALISNEEERARDAHDGDGEAT